MSQYTERLHNLFQLEFFGMKLGLENIRALLEHLGNPERKYPAIHIAGTNGKGSVAAMLAAVHRASGRNTGLYTSPHLVDFRERIRINGEMISEAVVADFLERIWPKVEELKATFFEVTTAMAFEYFAMREVDIAIIETGLGGRLDATNILEKPLATVVTSIGYDHIEQLGPTLEEIAGEKAGIFKSGAPAVVNCRAELDPVFRGKAAAVGCLILFVSEWRTPKEFQGIMPSLPGVHQNENLKTALAALSVLQQKFPLEIIETGIRETAMLTGICARLEIIVSEELDQHGLKLFIDVAHNSDAFDRIKQFFEANSIEPITVAGLMKDKDIDAILVSIRSFAKRFVAVNANTSRAIASSELNERAKIAGMKSENGGNVLSGLSLAVKNAKPGETILLTGSHYVVGEFLKNFQRTGRVIVN